jgi:hypothetical protein
LKERILLPVVRTEAIKDQIVNEELSRRPIGSTGDYESLVTRKPDGFAFHNSPLPTLQLDKLSLTLLKEEELIKPFYETFEKVQRRIFHDAGLRDAMSVEPVRKEQVDAIKSRGIIGLWGQENAVSAKMFLLKEYFSNLYQASVNRFKEVFPTVTECDVVLSNKTDFGLPTGLPVPIFLLKEKGVTGWMPLHEFSSGMQKVL